MASKKTDFDALDESQLAEDGGERYLFQWLSATENALKDKSTDALKSIQNDAEAALVKVIAAPAPFPSPGRPFRNAVSRCLLHIYRTGETKTLYDTIQTFLKIAGDVKAFDRDTHKTASLYCVGELMAEFGTQVMSLVSEVVNITIKIYRSNSSTLLRYHALIALEKTISSAKRAVTEATSRDIVKYMRQGLNDKALAVQRAASDVLIVMHPEGETQITPAEVESLVTLCVKSLDGADQLTRCSLSRLVGHFLALTQQRLVVVVPEQKKTKKKDPKAGEEVEDDDPPPVVKMDPEDVKTILTPVEMLHQLSTPYNKLNTTRKARIGIFDFYAATLTRLGSQFVERNYTTIVQHFMSELVTHARSLSTRYEILLARRLIGLLLRELIGDRLLSEQAQITAIQELSSTYLRKWPALMPGQVAPPSQVLTIALKEVGGLLEQLGNAPPPVQEALAEPLVTLLGHPSHTTRVHAAWTLKRLCHAAPLRLPKVVFSVMELLQRDITSITSPAAPSDIDTRTLGHAYGLSALIAIIAEQPLYVSYDISVKALDMATLLLKRAAEHDVKVAGVEVEVAWTMIASLMALGPNFVRAHLAQLLVLWRNALPKHTSKDAMSRSVTEWMFLLHVRESALGAVLNFLRYNASLVTLDVARRISSLLANALSFANTFISQPIEEPPEIGSSKAMNLRTRETLLRRRIYQCFTALGFSSIAESTQASLIQSTVSLFASPEGYAGSSVQAAIASSSGSFTSIWQSVDAYAYGLTGLETEDRATASARLNRDTVENHLDEMLRKPILTSNEHDTLGLCQTRDGSAHGIDTPPPATGVVDAAIELFAQILPLQDTTACVRAVTQLLDSVKSPKLERNAGRKAAVSVNAAIAILMSLRVSATLPANQIRDNLCSAQVTTALSPFLKDSIVEGDVTLRAAGSESIGRLASVAGTSFLTAQIKTLVDQVVSNRDPYARAGCALAFGSIYEHVGGLAAGPLLKTTVNVLISLGNDPHPVVHFWAVYALSQVINAASLAYAPFVHSTLGILLKLYTLETHEPEGGTLNASNLSGDLPVYQPACQTVDAVINVLGPDIQESSRTRALILGLVQEFSLEEDEGIRVEAIKGIQHFLMFAPEHVRIQEFVLQFRAHLGSSRRPLKLASINALYQLVQKDALAMSKIGGDRLVEELFAMLDSDPSIDGVRNVITSWLQQTVVYNPSAWIDLCQRIMSRTTASQRAADAASKPGALQDDEGESLSLGTTELSSGGQVTSRWRTQLFALQCLHAICSTIASSGRREHIDIPFALRQGLSPKGLLVTRVSDLIKMAFTASAAYVPDVRLQGLQLLRDVLEVFSRSPDPDYEESLLLEQHQAPITAALTPAFSADSTPEILASAVKACAVFVGSGIVKDVTRMGRILKLLTSALEQSKEDGTISLGDARDLSPNASVMIRIATVSAWAELAVASMHQPYLLDVLKPHRATLASSWIACLRDYASIQAGSDMSQDASSVTIDATSFSLGKDVFLPYYRDTWSVILHAVNIAMQTQDPFVLAAIDGREPSDGVAADNAKAREDPATFFFVLFGLAYEALATSSVESAAGGAQSTRQTSIIALQALKYLVRPEYSGTSFLQTPAFQELISLCYRIAMTEPPSVQVRLVGMVAELASSHAPQVQSADLREGFPSGIAHTHCLRICGQVLRNAIPGANTSIIHADASATDRIQLVNVGFDAFATVALTFGPAWTEELRAVAVSLYNEFLKEENSPIDITSPTLQSLKSLLEVKSEAPSGKYDRVAHAILSSCLSNIDQMRGRAGPVVSRKIKTNLLAAVLILTVVPPTVKVGRPAIEHCCFIISEKLLDEEEVSLTAVHCAKTLIVAASNGNLMLRHCTKMLLPGLVEYVARIATVLAEGGATDKHSAGASEVVKAFAAFFAVVPPDQRALALGVLLPTLALLLDSSGQVPPTPIHTEVVAQILAFATTDAAAFKDVTARLDQAARDTLETAVRQAVGSRAAGSAQQAAKPQISLRSF